MEQSFDYIQALLEQFDFVELSGDDRQKVLQHITEAEYQQRRNIITNSEKLFENEAVFLNPEPEIKSNLDAALREKKSNKAEIAWWALLFSFRMPAYQVGLAILLVIIAWQWFRPAPVVEFVEREKIVFQTQTDTVVKTAEIIKEVPVVHTVIQTKYLPAPTPSTFSVNFPEEIQENERLITNNSFELPAEAQQEQLENSLSNSPFATSDLEGLMVRFN